MRSDADAIASFAQTAFEHIADTELAPTCFTSVKHELRAITNSDGSRDNAVITSSATPSAKKSCLGSVLHIGEGQHRYRRFVG